MKHRGCGKSGPLIADDGSIHLAMYKLSLALSLLEEDFFLFPN